MMVDIEEVRRVANLLAELREAMEPSSGLARFTNTVGDAEQRLRAVVAEQMGEGAW